MDEVEDSGTMVPHAISEEDFVGSLFRLVAVKRRRPAPIPVQVHVSTAKPARPMIWDWG